MSDVHVDPDAQFPVDYLSFRIGDTLPTIYRSVIDQFGNPLDLTGKGVLVRLRRVSGQPAAGEVEWVRDAVVTGNAALGEWQYDVQDGDFSDLAPGVFELTAEIYSTVGGTLELTAPTDSTTFVNLRSGIG